MVRRPGDKTPEPEGGRVAQRLRMFEEARRPKKSSSAQKTKPAKKTKKDARAKKGNVT
jgi:hypothetical protein